MIDTLIFNIKYKTDENNNKMKELKITAPEGYEIDKEKSSFEKIVFKEVEKCKYPTLSAAIWWYEKRGSILVTTKYLEKLSILDRLLIARDKWNEIDGFVADYSNRYTKKYSLQVWGEKIQVNIAFELNSKFTFNTRETAQLFLDTFRKELEEIKEFI